MKYKRKEVIGGCELYSGDCIEVMSGFADNSIDMIWTDPPYGNSNNDGDLNAALSTGAINGRAFRAPTPIMNDSAEEMRIVVDEMLTQAARIIRKKAAVCCCCGGGPSPTFAWLANRMDADGLSFFHSVIWDKVNPGLGWRYKRQHEMVMVAHMKGGGVLWADEARATPNIKRVPAPCGQIRLHPNEKPLELVSGFIESHTNKGHIVMDPFMGSGTTGVACAKMGRKFIGIELDEEYFDIACRRIEEAYKQPDMFVDSPATEVEQYSLLD